jgi:hypothetical protein
MKIIQKILIIIGGLAVVPITVIIGAVEYYGLNVWLLNLVFDTAQWEDGSIGVGATAMIFIGVLFICIFGMAWSDYKED